MIAIVVIGLARSGKDAAADYLAEKYDFKKFVFSDLLAEELKKMNIEPTKMNMVRLGDQLREKHHMAILAERLYERTKKEKICLFVGARSLEEYNYIKDHAEKSYLLRIQSDRSKRFDRKSGQDPNSEAAFFDRDELDIQKKGFGKLIESADKIIDNNGTLEQLYEKLDNFMKKIILKEK